MNKVGLVALREYLDNVRTKTFWLGVLLFPFLITLAILVPIWLQDAKDVRRYAVLDRSGWLLDAMDRARAGVDYEAALRLYRERFEPGGEAYRTLDPERRKLVDGVREALARVPAKQLDGAIKQLAKLLNADATPESKRLRDALPASVREQLEPMRIALADWWIEHRPPGARAEPKDATESRYQRVPADTDAPDAEKRLNGMLARGEIFAYFVIGADPMGENEDSKYVSNNLTDDELRKWLSDTATRVVRRRRMAAEGIARETMRRIQAPVRFAQRQLSETGQETEVETTDIVRQWAPVVFTYLLWITIITTGQMLLSSLIEEKSNRIIEVLLSSVSALQLMAGKILGIAATGLTLIATWIVWFFLIVKLLPSLVSEFPEVDLSVLFTDPGFLFGFVVYFVLGYLLIAALLVGIGSVCNSLKDAQNLMTPVVLLLILPMLALVPIGQDPNGTLAVVLSFIPPFTPFVMMNRAAGPPTGIEYAATTLLLIVSIAVALWAAAKVFRIGVLMTGKPPRLREILRWIAAPVGQMPARGDADLKGP